MTRHPLDELEQPTTREQIDLFSQLTAPLKGERAMANSAGIPAWRIPTADWIRPGVIPTASPLPLIRWRPITACSR